MQATVQAFLVGLVKVYLVLVAGIFVLLAGLVVRSLWDAWRWRPAEPYSPVAEAEEILAEACR